MLLGSETLKPTSPLGEQRSWVEKANGRVRVFTEKKNLFHHVAVLLHRCWITSSMARAGT